MIMRVPFVDLKSQYRSIKKEIDHAIQQVIEDTAFVRGKYVKEFEEEYASKYGVRHCIGVGNGTDAIYIALKMMGVDKGDEVITAANTWISTSETISQTGAKPVFVDIDPKYYTLNVDELRSKITSATKVIIPVHFYGQAADMESIMQIARENDIEVLEDCAQAHFSEDQGNRVGLIGRAATFSFYPSKNLGAYGDAGCIITNDDELAKRIRMFANHGSLNKHEHVMEGINSRLDGLQAAILKVKLGYLDNWIEKRIQNAQYYDDLLGEIEQIVIPKVRPNTKHTYHVYVVRCQGNERDDLMKFLKNKGIETSIHYPAALPGLKAYEYLNLNLEEFRVALDFQSKILSLPMYPELSEEMIEYVCDSIHQFYHN